MPRDVIFNVQVPIKKKVKLILVDVVIVISPILETDSYCEWLSVHIRQSPSVFQLSDLLHQHSTNTVEYIFY